MLFADNIYYTYMARIVSDIHARKWSLYVSQENNVVSLDIGAMRGGAQKIDNIMEEM